MKIYSFGPAISLIDIAPPIPYFEGYVGVYVLRGDKVAIIDPGPASFLGNLFSALEEMNINTKDVIYILASHIHLDHTGGVGAALQKLPNAMVVAHEKGKPHLADPTRLWKSSLQVSGELVQHYGQPQPVPPERMVTAEDGMAIDLGGMKAEVLFTPGHASHSLSFYDRAGRNLFEGESAGVYVQELDQIRLSSPPPFNLENMLSSIARLISLGPETIYFSHFGRAYNALERLRFLKEQLILWGKVISVYTNQEWQDILEILKKEDRSLDSLKMLPLQKQERELLSMRMSIQGYMEYFRRFGKGAFNRGG